MFISGKEVITINDKNFIRVSDAMQIITPTATSASRWFQQHQELFSPETFVNSDERFPGKKGRIWLTVPEGFQALAKACIEAPRLKVPDGVEARIAPFVSPVCDACETPSIDFRLLIASQGSQPSASDFRPSPSSPQHPSEPDVENPARGEDEVEIEFDVATQPNGIVYKEPQEKIYGLTVEGIVEDTTPLPPFIKGEGQGNRASTPGFTSTTPSTPMPSSSPESQEEWVDFLTHTISNLVARYHVKMGWLDKMNKEAPVEIYNSIVDLFTTLHDKLVDDVINEILKFKGDASHVVGPFNQWEKFDEYLAKNYEISFEANKDGVLCRILSATIDVNAIGANYCQAFERAVGQIFPLQS